MPDDVKVSLKRFSLVAGVVLTAVGAVWAVSTRHAEAMVRIEANTKAIELLIETQRSQADAQAKTNEILARMDERWKAYIERQK